MVQEAGSRGGPACSLVQRTMVAQEACFQAQLRELHRLCSVQRYLMERDTRLCLGWGRFGLKESHDGALDSSSGLDSEHGSNLLRLSSTSSHSNREGIESRSHVSRPFACRWRPPPTLAPAETSGRLMQIHPHPAGEAPRPLYHTRTGWGGAGGAYFCPSPAWGAPRAPFKQPPPLVLLRGRAGEEMRLIPAEVYVPEKQGETSASSSLGEGREGGGGGEEEEAAEGTGYRESSSGDVVDPGDRALPRGRLVDGGLVSSQRAAQVLMSFSPRKGVKRRLPCKEGEL